MALAAGDKLGPYEILASIGAGGMGEVFRARDTMLKREVALKVLPAAFVQDPERMARFQREAEVLASLDHPNIGPIYGLVESDGSRSLVLALIEGPTLADHLRSDPYRKRKRSRLRVRSPKRWNMRMTTESCIATLSPPTSR